MQTLHAVTAENHATPGGTEVAIGNSMLKTTKKLRLNKEQLRVLTDTDLDRTRGGYPTSAGSGWCSSDNFKCSHGCGLTISVRCVNR